METGNRKQKTNTTKHKHGVSPVIRPHVGNSRYRRRFLLFHNLFELDTRYRTKRQSQETEEYQSHSYANLEVMWTREGNPTLCHVVVVVIKHCRDGEFQDWFNMPTEAPRTSTKGSDKIITSIIENGGPSKGQPGVFFTRFFFFCIAPCVRTNLFSGNWMSCQPCIVSDLMLSKPIFSTVYWCVKYEKRLVDLLWPWRRASKLVW